MLWSRVVGRHDFEDRVVGRFRLLFRLFLSASGQLLQFNLQSYFAYLDCSGTLHCSLCAVNFCRDGSMFDATCMQDAELPPLLYQSRAAFSTLFRHVFVECPHHLHPHIPKPLSINNGMVIQTETDIAIALVAGSTLEHGISKNQAKCRRCGMI